MGERLGLGRVTNHEHTAILFDCRPMKAAALDVLARHERGQVDKQTAVNELYRLAASLPDLDPRKFSSAVGSVMGPGPRGYDRARRLVNAIHDRTLRPWVRWAIATVWLSLCASVFVGLVAFAVWLVT